MAGLLNDEYVLYADERVHPGTACYMDGNSKCITVDDLGSPIPDGTVSIILAPCDYARIAAFSAAYGVAPKDIDYSRMN